MNFYVILIEAVIFAVFFTTMVLVGLFKGDLETPNNIHNYPKGIQDEYFKTHERIDVSYKSKKVLLTKGFGVILFTVILAICSYFAGATTFSEGFLVAFGLMVWIGLYDTLFIDWVLFANIKKFRLPGTEHMDKEYHQKWFHLKGILFPGIIFALIPGVVVGLITLLF